MSTEKAKPNEPRWQSDPDPAKKCKPDAKSAENVKGEKKKLTGMGSNLRKLRTQIQREAISYGMISVFALDYLIWEVQQRKKGICVTVSHSRGS